jgi:hypothetical protein
MVALYVTAERVEPFIAAAEAIPRHELIAMTAGLPAPWVIEPDAPEKIADVLLARVKLLRTTFSYSA